MEVAQTAVLTGMMAVLAGIIIPTVFFVTIIFIISIIFKAHLRKRDMLHKERLAIIEKGLVDKAQFIFSAEPSPGIKLSRYLVWGLILAALGIAHLVSIIMIKLLNAPIFDITIMIIFGLIFLFIGVALILFYIIQSKKEKEENTIRNQPHS